MSDLEEDDEVAFEDLPGDEQLKQIRGRLEEIVAEREVPGAESQTFAQYGLVLIDRVNRLLDELRAQMRYADETLLLSSLGGNINPIQLTVINDHHQSFGIRVERVGSEVRLAVTHRGQPGMIDIPRGQMHQEEL